MKNNKKIEFNLDDLLSSATTIKKTKLEDTEEFSEPIDKKPQLDETQEISLSKIISKAEKKQPKKKTFGYYLPIELAEKLESKAKENGLEKSTLLELILKTIFK